MSFPFRLPLLLDGACGTCLMECGMPEDACCEQWMLTHREETLSLLRGYVEAGVHAIYVPTFGANRQRLAAFGLENEVERINTELAALAREAVQGTNVLLGGSVGPAFVQIGEDEREFDFDDLYDIYAEQITALKKAGVDFIALETQMNLADLRAGLLAAKSFKLPVLATVTVDENGETNMAGASPLSCLITLQAMGVDAFGVNCSSSMDAVCRTLLELKPHTRVPLIAKPGLGMPKTLHPPRYDMTPTQFATEMQRFLQSGIAVVGGCCGSTPEHLRALAKAMSALPAWEESALLPQEPDDFACTLEKEVFFLGDDVSLSEPIECSYGMVDDLIDLEDEDEINTFLLEVNSSDDARLLIESAPMLRLPICVHTDDAVLLDYTLRNFQGRMLVDSDCAIEREVLESIGNKYGAIIY